MDDNLRVVSCVGYHVTGSGAVDDYLKEFGSCVSTPFEKECRFIQDPDGISDLEYNLIQNWHRLNSGFAIKRFRSFCKRYNASYSAIFGKEWMRIVDEYLEKLISFTFKGYWHADIRVQRPIPAVVYYLKRILQNILHIPPWKWNLLPNEKTYHVYLTEDEFINKTQIFTDKLIRSARNGNNEGFLLLEQLIPTTNIKKCMRYFSDIKVIIVDRDPRDVYITHARCNMHVLPYDVDKFCESYVDSRRNIKFELEGMQDQVLFVKFEDLIYKYDTTTDNIKKFLGIDESDHLYPMAVFDPNVSANNTKQWLNFPEYRYNCDLIEQKIPEYLYKFD